MNVTHTQHSNENDRVRCSEECRTTAIYYVAMFSENQHNFASDGGGNNIVVIVSVLIIIIAVVSRSLKIKMWIRACQRQRKKKIKEKRKKNEGAEEGRWQRKKKSITALEKKKTSMCVYWQKLCSKTWKRM